MENPERLGFSLTEMAIVLGLVGAVLSAIWVAASRVNDQYRVNRAATQIQLIAQNARGLWGQNHMNFAGSTDETSTWVQLGIIPADLVRGTRTRNSWGGLVQIWTTPGDYFWISYFKVPSRACVGLAAALLQKASGNSGSGPISFCLNGCTSGVPTTNFDLATVTALCSQNAVNQVEFYYSQF